MTDALLKAVATIDDTPTLLINWPVVERNVARMAELARDRSVDLRPHMKTHKMVSLARLQMDAGAVGLTVAKLGEADVMVRNGIDNLLIAYPVVGASHLQHLMALASEARIAVSLDSWEAAEPIIREARRTSVDIGLLVEVDTGLHRCGVAPGEPAIELARRIAEAGGARFEGLMTHEGHAYAAPTPEAMRQATVDAAAAMKETADAIRQLGIPVPVVTMGSAGTARFGIGLDGITEFRPGTYVFNDRSQLALGACQLEDCAALVVTTVVSHSQPGEAVVDAGSKTFTRDPILTGRGSPTFGVLLDDETTEVVRLSEEHGILGGAGAGRLSIGDRVAVLPNHICPIVNLFDEVHVLHEDGTVAKAPVDARGKSR
jgi:D-serine deaminase-like pyridoxal phosphate-dependent protein